jgi:hypothetical protein
MPQLGQGRHGPRAINSAIRAALPIARTPPTCLAGMHSELGNLRVCGFRDKLNKPSQIFGDLAHAEDGYHWSDVSLTALLITNGDADFCIRNARAGLAHIGMSARPRRAGRQSRRPGSARSAPLIELVAQASSPCIGRLCVHADTNERSRTVTVRVPRRAYAATHHVEAEPQLASTFELSNGSDASEIAGSQVGSQRRQTLGYVRPQPACIYAAKHHVRPHLAPSGYDPNVPSK